MAYDGLVTSYLGQGVAASRPATPNISPNAIAFYYATDTGATTVWGNSAWRTFTSSTPAAVTFNNGGAGAASGTTFDGSTARTISYNTIGAQPLDGTLTALAAYNTNGVLVQTAADTFAGRTITAGSAKISISNGSGVAGNPTIDLGAVAATDITMSTARLLGRTTASTGAVEEITVGSGLTLAAGSLSASGTSGPSIGLVNALSIGLVSL